MATSEKLTKWRLILGKHTDSNDSENGTGSALSLSKEMQEMDAAMEVLYNKNQQRGGGLEGSSPKVNRWLGDIRKYFPKSVVKVMQKDAIERLGLGELLLQPEILQTLEPDVNLVATLLTLKDAMPDESKATARYVVQKVTDELQKKLAYQMQQAVTGALNRAVRNFNPKLRDINWHLTIKANLKNYQEDYKTIIPERLVGYGKKTKQLRRVILLIDESGSMAASVVYSGIFGAVLASLPSISTHIVAFDTAVVDLTELSSDPVDILFGTQLGGGTDICKALMYGQSLVTHPTETIMILISDLYEGGSEAKMIAKAAEIKAEGIQFITLLALSDEGAPSYDKEVAKAFAALDIPVFACTPDLFPDVMAAAIKKEDLKVWMSKHNVRHY